MAVDRLYHNSHGSVNMPRITRHIMCRKGSVMKKIFFPVLGIALFILFSAQVLPAAQVGGATGKDKKPVKFGFSGLIGAVGGFQGGDVVVNGNDGIGRQAPIGKVLVVDADGERVYLESTFPMQTVVKGRVIRGDRAKIKKGMKVYLNSYEIQSDEAADDETKDETEPEPEPVLPKKTADSDVEFMHRAGLFDEEPYGFFRKRISVAYNLFDIKYFKHTRELDDKRGCSNGIAIQYHCGVSFTRGFDWRGNPLFGVNLLFDGSIGFGVGGNMMAGLVNAKGSDPLDLGAGWNIMTLGFGGEVHFLWIFKIAAGYTYVNASRKIFYSGGYDHSPAVKRPPDKKSGMLLFLQGGISLPVSNKSDIFALISFSDGPDARGAETRNYRVGIARKF